MNNKFTEREKGFEKKFARDEELQFKVQARSNKYIAEFVLTKLGKNENEKEKYPVEGKEGEFYKRRIDTDNAKTYETFLEGMVEVNDRLKEKNKPEPSKIKLPKLKKVDGE